MNQPIAELVAHIRQSNGLTQEALARHLGVTFSTVNAWEAGRSMPQPRHRLRLEQMARGAQDHGDALTVLISDPNTRPRKDTLRALRDASDALGMPIVVHEEADELCALVKLGLLRPSIVVFRAPRQNLNVPHILARLDRFPELLANPIVLLTDEEHASLATRASDRVQVMVGAISLADAGALLRRATALNATLASAVRREIGLLAKA